MDACMVEAVGFSRDVIGDEGGEGVEQGGNWGEVPLLEVLDSGYSLLRVGYDFCEEVGEAGATQLGGASAIEVSVIDGFAV